MTYNLFFRQYDRTKVVDAHQFKAYFDVRPNYTESDLRFYDYEDEENDVYFTLLYSRSEDGSIPRPDLNPEEDLATAEMSFGGSLESLEFVAAELEAFVKHFNLEFNDPQADGYELYKPFTKQAFIASMSESLGFANHVVEHFAAQGEHILVPSPPKKKRWWPF
jgi:hypothetical protein